MMSTRLSFEGIRGKISRGVPAEEVATGLAQPSEKLVPGDAEVISNLVEDGSQSAGTEPVMPWNGDVMVAFQRRPG